MRTPKQDLIFTNPDYAHTNYRPFDSNVFSINGTMWF
jgi:hypothetical protein